MVNVDPTGLITEIEQKLIDGKINYKEYIAMCVAQQKLNEMAGIGGNSPSLLNVGSTENPVIAYQFGTGTENVTLISSGTHLYESQGNRLAALLITELMKENLPDGSSVIVIPGLDSQVAVDNGGIKDRYWDGDTSKPENKLNRTFGLENSNPPDQALMKAWDMLGKNGIKDSNITAISLHSFQSDHEFYTELSLNIAPGYDDRRLKFINGESTWPKPPIFPKSMALAKSVLNGLNTIGSLEKIQISNWHTQYQNDYQDWVAHNHSASRFIEFEFNNQKDKEFIGNSIISPLFRVLINIIRGSK